MSVPSAYARFGAWWVVLVALFSLGTHAGFAQSGTLPPSVQNGVTWLNAQVQSDGSLGAENASIATAYQARAETLLTLKSLATAPGALANALAATTDGDTEYVARQIEAAAASGQSTTNDVALLLALQNADGGWGLQAGYQSNALDTAFALQALLAANAGASPAIANALGYLGQAKLSDGGWGVGGQSSIYISANVLLAANGWSSRYVVAATTSAARDWLLAQRDATQKYASVLDDALALRALATQTSQAAVLQPLSDALNAAQQADGSWLGDPYVTALALNALAFVSQPPPNPNTGDVQGKVVDQSNGNPVTGATVQLVEISANTSTAGDGTFVFAGIAPASYTLRVSALGYQTSNTTIQITAGQVLNLGSLNLKPAPLTAAVQGTVRNNSGQALQNVLVTLGTSTALTDVSGAYQLTGLSPGPATISAALNGYQTASGSVTLAAGTTYLFSPTLYPTNSTPPPTSLQGTVVDGASSAAIAGASVTLNGTTQTTGAAGTFSFTNLSAGAFTLSISAAGHQGVSATGTLVAGANNVGKIALPLQPQTSTLSGLVTDGDSNAPIAGATLAIQGQPITATSDATGHYQLSGISGTNLTVQVGATGYLTQTLGVTLPQVGNGTLNIALTKPAASGLSFSEVAMASPTYNAHDTAELELTLNNSTPNAISVVIVADVEDAQNNVAFQFRGNVHGLGQDPPNLPVIVPANGSLDLEIQYAMLRQAAGPYSVHAMAIDGSGRVLAQGDTQFSVVAQALLAGGLNPDPPLAQVGTQQPIKLSADLTNVGNVAIAPGTLNLSVLLQNADTQSNTQAQTQVKTFAGGVPLNSTHGLVSDGNGGFFTANLQDNKVLHVDASGSSSVLATLPQTIGVAGLCRDPQQNLWVVGSYTNTFYKVSPQGATTPFQSTALNSIYGAECSADGGLFLTGYAYSPSAGMNESRLVQRTAAGQETVLWRNGLPTPYNMVKDDAGNFVVCNYSDNTLTKIAPASGTITPFASGLNRPVGIARDAQGNFYVANLGGNTVSKVSPSGVVSTYASGLNQPSDVKLDASGNLFVTNQGSNSVAKVLPDGTVQTFATGIANGPEGMRYDAAGNLWIANDDGTLRKKDVNDVSTTVATGLTAPRGMAIDGANNVYVANYSGNVVTRFNGTTNAVFASGLANPYGVAIDAAGELYVTERGANRITILSAAGSKTGAVDSMLYNPSVVRFGKNGETYVHNYDSITVIENGTPRVLTSGNLFSGYIAPDYVNGGVLATASSDVYRIALDGTRTRLNAAAIPFSMYGLGTDAAGNVLLLDYNGKRIEKLAADGTLSQYAALPEYAPVLVTDPLGNVFVQANNVVYSVDTSGNATKIPVATSEYVYYTGPSSDGKLLAYTTASHVFAVDPVSGATTLLLSNVGNINALARDAGGNLLIADTPNQELRTYVNGTQTGVLNGFIAPWDIVWTGSEFRFVDNNNRFFALTPGGLPRKLGGFNPNFLTIAPNGEIYGSSPGSGLVHWNGSAQETWQSFNNMYLSGGIAARADGALSVAENGTSRVLTVSSTHATLSDFAGLVRPVGLAFDAQGAMYVANYGSSTIVRFAPGSSAASVFARLNNPLYLTFDASNTLYASFGGGVDKIDASGPTLVSNALAVNGLLFDQGQLYALDGNNGQLRRFDTASKTWAIVAAGLADARGVRLLPSGDLLVANHGNGTVSRYSNGTLTTLVASVPGADSVAPFADGTVYVGGDSGLLYRVASDGSATDMHISHAINNFPVYGLVQSGTSPVVYAQVTGYNNSASTYQDAIVSIAISQPVAPPPVGTVVYQTTVPMPALPAADGYLHLDLGQWLPPYGGDFRIDVSRSDAGGGATNFVHVGPSAYGALTALEPTLPPGDQTESMCLSLNGADFTSISRVETAEVRPVVNITQPYGMAADKDGNIYYTDSTTLYKTNVQGVSSTVATGMALRFGLAADSQSNLYLTARNNTTNSFDLLRFDPSGKKTTVANLGVANTNGVQVNSHDEILVGSPGRLLKVTQDGTISTVSYQGLPQPRGIAVDGKDNVYVQNEQDYVSEIKADGTVIDVFSKGDGVIDPQFEGDGYPNIAADCSDNFYIATYNWARLGPNVQQFNEEHTLAQVIARTGQVSLLFDALKIDPNLGDIDYLAFDRFGSRILMWNHNQGKLWQVPVTCGAIGVQAHLVTQPGQTLSGMSVPQSATIPRANGATEYVWSLKDVTASGQQVCFDTKLTGLALGETRATLGSGFFTFQNSFAPNDVQVPLDVPTVHVDNLLHMTVVTDQADYPAKSTAQVTTQFDNSNNAALSGALSVNVYDAANVLVGQVTLQNVNIPANGSLPVTAPFPIGTIIPAQYTVKAVLSRNGAAQAQATTAFNVLPDNVGASAVSSVHTDKQSYNANDSVAISSRAQSQSANVILSNLTLMVQVFDAGGTLQFTHGFAIDQLLPGALRDFSTTDALVNAAPGIYTVKQDLIDDQGRAFDHQEAAFNVTASSDTGFGLSGTIAAAPKSLAVGATVNLAANVTDRGNSAFSNLPLTIAIVDPGSNATLAHFDGTASIGIGATVPYNASWVTQGQVGATYFAVLSATVGSGKNLVLAVDTFTLSAPSTHLDASITLTPTLPPMAALVLLDAGAPAAETARIRAQLSAIGFAATFVSTPDAFAGSVRSGAYQLYLVLATQVAPDATTERLLREAVHRGEGLLYANGSAALSDVLAQVSGVKGAKALPTINAQSLDVAASAPGGAAHTTFNPTLPARIVAPQSAQTQATFTGRLPATPDAGSLSSVVATLGRADLGYYGTDAGTNGSHLALASVGRLHDAQGKDSASVWRLRNSGDTPRTVVLASVALGWSATFTIASHTDTYVASPVVAGSADHRLSENGIAIQTQSAITTLFSDTRTVDAGDNPGAIALWANALNTSGALQWSGAQHELHGAIHSNSDIKLAGAQNTLDGPVHYVSSLQISGSQNTLTYQPRQVAAQPLPTLLNLDDFRPGGAVAQALGAQYLDQSAECASKHSWQRTTKQLPLASGVYWIPCDVQISGSDAGGTVTLVSTGSIQISGSRASFQPFYRGLQFGSSSNGTAAVQISGSSAALGGLLFAPNGTIQLSGSSMNLACSVIANQIQLAGAKTVIDARHCAYAPIEQKTPALLLNAFGAGTAAYAAFDWQGAISQYESATPGVLTTLFGASANRAAPTQNPLRAGTVLALGTAVKSLADPFTGSLRLAANDDSAFVPATPTWALDFSTQTQFQATDAVRLGSGASTTLTATVAAATPQVVDPLKQASITVTHLAGESVADLIAAVSAIGNRDAGLNAALVALQGAQAALAANDREGATQQLLNAAEACGQSSNAQADALRTRIDWVLWANTH